MPSLIAELQRDALNQGVSVTEILQKCLLVATKLGIGEFADWARLELDGYKTKELPEYRVISGEPVTFDPYKGYEGLRIKPHSFSEILSKIQVNQSISEIEGLHRQADRANNGGLPMLFGPDTEKSLMDRLESPKQPYLFVRGAALRNILDVVREMVLEWSLKLESDGIIGEGMSFSREEKHKAQSVT